jgi:Tol biopolymer transport system component
MGKGSKFAPLLALALALALGNGQPAHAAQSIKQVSVTRRADDPARESHHASLSSDGRYVAFESFAGDLVSGDHTIRWPDIFVRDTVTGGTVRASVDTIGGDPDGPSYRPSMSADGRYVAFESDASDLVADDGNGLSDVFVRDLVAGTTFRASVDTGSGDSDGDAQQASITADGRYVAFNSVASDLVPGDGNGYSDVFVRDLVSDTTIRASVDTEGGDSDSESGGPSIDAGGRYVAFESAASDLVRRDGSGTWDVFVRDIVAETTLRASVDEAGGDPNGANLDPSISADGRYVVFESEASDIVSGDGNGFEDCYVRDVEAGITTRASIDIGGGDPDGECFAPSISADGRYVAFDTDATDLVTGDGNFNRDVFIRDLTAGTTVRVSIDADGGDPNGDSWFAAISADGRHVAFESCAPDLMSEQGDRGPDIFVARM